MKKMYIKITLIVLACIAVATTVLIFSINDFVKKTGGQSLITSEKAAELSDVDCILVLGCQVKEDGTPSDMLADRLKRGVELYDLGAAPKLLMSGDHGREDYNEVGAMKQYAIEVGVPSEDVFMDHAGFSTYESIYRAKEIFGAEKIIIVTQEYHLYRALYIAEALDMEAYGVACDYNTYAGQFSRDMREVLARVKDFITGIVKPEPAVLGEAIPVSGNGDATNDK